MKKILLLGGSGMLGRAFQDVLSGHDDCELKSCSKTELNVCDKDALRSELEVGGYDFVINCAAYTAVDDAEEDRDRAFKVNAEAVKGLAGLCKEFGVTLIHFSTDYVFAGDNMVGYREDEEPDPINVYGESKLAGEIALAESGCDYYLVRTSWLYGAGGKNFVDTMLALAEKSDQLSVVGDQFGSPTYAWDLADMVVKSFVISEEALENGIYHLTNTGSLSWYEFAKAIFDEVGKDILVERVTSEEFERPAKRPSYSMLLNSKLPSMQPWRKALAKYLNI